MLTTSKRRVPHFNGSGDDGVSGSDDGDHGDNSVDDDIRFTSMN